MYYISQCINYMYYEVLDYGLKAGEDRRTPCNNQMRHIKKKKIMNASTLVFLSQSCQDDFFFNIFYCFFFLGMSIPLDYMLINYLLLI